MFDIAIKIILEIVFLAVSKVKINFADYALNCRIYTLDDALPITKRVQSINQKKFVVAALATDKEAFVMHITYLRVKILIHLAQKAQMALLLA